MSNLVACLDWLQGKILGALQVPEEELLLLLTGSGIRETTKGPYKQGK